MEIKSISFSLCSNAAFRLNFFSCSQISKQRHGINQEVTTPKVSICQKEKGHQKLLSPD